MEILIIGGIVLLFPVLFVIAQFNGLVALRNHIRDAWANVDTELKRRYDLIPNLVATVKGYAAHERDVLERVVELRNRCAAHAGAGTANQADEKELVASLQRLFAVVENYPQLKADQHFLRLQDELVNTEDRIQAARRFYNGNVRDYRDQTRQFPGVLVANAFRFGEIAFFEVESPAMRHAPAVSVGA